MADYIAALQKEYSKGDATEHSHRPALKALIECSAIGVQATNEPAAIEKENKPDYIIRRAASVVGFVEAKDLGIDLGAAVKTAQIKRYLEALPNLILTNYLEFVWFAHGQEQMRAKLGSIAPKGLQISADAETKWKAVLNAFLLYVSPTISTSAHLSKVLAGQTRLLRELTAELLAAGDTDLSAQETSFKTLLVPDITRSEFADMYAQTAAYGLFTARVFEHATLLAPSVEVVPKSMASDPFSLEKAAYLIPKANPFLRQFFLHVASPALSGQLRWLIEQIAEALRYVDVEKVLHKQQKKQGFEDPVFHFYETFLAEYDKEIREQRGVYYTPEPVVDFIVRGVDELLRTKFKREGGLASKDAIILDPATGTATFLRKVIELVHSSIKAGPAAGAWQQYVRERLIPRIFGFEWMMAPYTVAHLKLELQLQEQGYEFASNERLHVYLTNTLEQLHQKTHALLGQWIAAENEGAEKVKLQKPVEVVLGNPPYYGESRNKSPWIMQLLQSYKTEPEGGPLKEKNSKWLNNDYVKFIRFAHDRLARTGHGIVAFITSNSWLDGPIFRGMRSQLMAEFDEIFILNLRGNPMRNDRTPPDLLSAQGEDKNVFDITEGVSISFFVKYEADEDFALTAPGQPKGKKIAGGKVLHKAKIRYADLWGSRAFKYDWLEAKTLDHVAWKFLEPRLPLLLLTPRDETDVEEYERGWKVTDIFPFSGTGIITKADELNIHFTAEECLSTMKWFVKTPEVEVREKMRLPKPSVRDWKVSDAVNDVLTTGTSPKNVRAILYRPFDTRYVYYTGRARGIIGWPVERLARQFDTPNMALITSRMTKGEVFAHAQVTDKISEVICMSSKTSNNGFVFPLWLVPEHVKQGVPIEKQRIPNLSPKFIAALAHELGLTPGSELTLPEGVSPEDVLYYVFAILYSPAYRRRYEAYLRSDFPRIPVGVISGASVSFGSVWDKMVSLGKQLVDTHLFKATTSSFAIGFPKAGGGDVALVRYEAPSSGSSGKVWINETQYFDGVPPETWGFLVGGYQVAEKWLRYRKGRVLSLDEIEHYQQILAAINRTRALMKDIDVVVDGTLWPTGS